MNTLTTTLGLAALLGLVPVPASPTADAAPSLQRAWFAGAAGAQARTLGQDASQCVRLEDGDNEYSAARLVNGCNFTIEVAWCAEGVDCDHGLSNMRTFSAGDSYPVNGTSGQRRRVNWGACVGRNTLSGSYGSMQYSCNDP